ncbi:MAG: hypothetical protein QOG30_3345 [Acidimicrobiaceae bacterium]
MSPVDSPPRRKRGRGDDGFILATFGLFLVAMMTIAALAIDVGAWYSRSSQLQRAADAAALAAVVWMPNLNGTAPSATSVALTTASKNGFTNGQNNITVTVAAVPGSTRQVKVTILDCTVQRYFSQFVIANQAITKSATAEYVMPLPLGSPKNTFGSGDLLTGSNAENFWAAVNGYCAGKESGDNRMAKWDQILGSSSLLCPTSFPNPDYDSDGYYYTIDVAAGSSGTLNLYLFDPAYVEASRPDLPIWPGSSVTTTFKLYGPGPNTFEIPTGGPLLQTTTYASGSTTYQDKWATFYSASATPGRYFLQVYTSANEANSFGINAFGIQAILGSGSPGTGAVGSGANACTTVVGATGYLATCPRVSGIDAISIFGNLANGTTASFYLTSVDPVYAGKTMDLQLFDPGEGALTMQVLDPNGSPVSFTWDTPCTAPPAAATGGCTGGPTTTLDVSGNGTQPVAGEYNAYKYNNRMVNVHIPLPASFATYSGKTWWKIAYTYNSAPNDRTTWSASISGNPVHLIQ